MSVVSGVTLITSCAEDIGRDELDGWLRSREIAASLIEVTDAGGGNKHPQTHVWCAGFNYFDEDNFAAFIGSQACVSPFFRVLNMGDSE